MANHPGHTHRTQGTDLARHLLPMSPHPSLAPLDHTFLSILPACRWEWQPGRRWRGSLPWRCRPRARLWEGEANTSVSPWGWAPHGVTSILTAREGAWEPGRESQPQPPQARGSVRLGSAAVTNIPESQGLFPCRRGPVRPVAVQAATPECFPALGPLLHPLAISTEVPCAFPQRRQAHGSPRPPHHAFQLLPRTALLFRAHSGPTPQLPEAWR